MSAADASGLVHLSLAHGGATSWEFTKPPAASSAAPPDAGATAKSGKISDAPTSVKMSSSSGGDSSSSSSSSSSGGGAGKKKKGGDRGKPAAAQALVPDPEPKMDFEHGADHGQCVGTLRWKSGASFPRLGAWPTELVGRAPKLTGWRDYLEWRIPADATGTIKVEAPLLDGLSYPLSLIHALQSLRLRPPQPGPLYLIIIGASSKAEERLVRDSDYWQELSRFFVGASIELVFCGPEMASATHGKVTRLSSHLTARNFHGTLGELLRKEPRHTAESTVVVGFNTGFGNCSEGMHKGGFPLMMGWLPDLIALLQLGLVAVFTCANDYSDLRGELTLFQTLHAEMILPPSRNPFKAATVVRESDAAKCEWSCSSCYTYAICGRTEGAPPLPPPESDLGELKKAVKKMAKKLNQTQTPSAVP